MQNSSNSPNVKPSFFSFPSVLQNSDTVDCRFPIKNLNYNTTLKKKKKYIRGYFIKYWTER